MNKINLKFLSTRKNSLKKGVFKSYDIKYNYKIKGFKFENFTSRY